MGLRVKGKQGKNGVLYFFIFLLIIFIVVLVIVTYLYLVDNGTIGTGFSIQSPIKVKSEADRCAERIFDCYLNCPTSTLSKNYISHRCFESCSKAYESQCEGTNENELSNENRNKISCLSGCATWTGTIKQDCAYRCLG